MTEEFAKYVVTNEIRFKHAKGMRDIIGKELHVYHEIFLFLGGDAEFISELGSTKLSPYTTVVIPKSTFHNFVVHGSESDYCRCVLNFENVSGLDELISEKIKRIFITQDETVASLFVKMRDIETMPLSDVEKSILLKGLFAQLLVYLKEPETPILKTPVDPVTDKAILYINQNISENLTVEKIAKAQHISESFLAHVFKKDMHISIHKYILEKRIFLADKKIKSNIPATQAALECGFQDYSGFYKQYKKMFGVSPTRKK